MKNTFNVHIAKFSNLTEIKGVWSSEDFKALLEIMEYEDHEGLSYEELLEVCMMSLQDLKPEKAAEIVLRYKMSDSLKEGQIKNLSVEMLDEKLWEEYADHSLHERLFNVGSLLYMAFPRSFPKPDAVSIKIEITAENEPAKKLLAGALDESFLLRLISGGMDEHSLLHRMFEDHLKGPSFYEASNIVWIVNSDSMDNDKRNVEIISSGCWLDPLEHINTFKSAAYSDACL